MTFKSSAIHVGIVTMLGALAGCPMARAIDLDGLYVGGSIGIAQFDNNNGRYQSQLQRDAAGFGTLDFTSAALTKRRLAEWIDTGYMFSPYVGIDLSYLHLGELYNQVTGTFTPSSGPSEFVSATTRLRSSGPAFGLLFRLPLVGNFDVDFRLADYYSQTRLTNILNANTNTVVEQTVNRSSLLLGVGAAYNFAGHFSARIDYLRIDKAGSGTVGNYSVDMGFAGVSYTF